MSAAEIDAALTEHFEHETTSDEWDESALHVSDFTDCTRSVWYRRNGHKKQRKAKLTVSAHRGKALEALFCQAIIDTNTALASYADIPELGLSQRDIWLGYDDDADVVRAGYGLPVHHTYAHGHIDLKQMFAERKRSIFEIKSMRFISQAPLAKNVYQCASYAFAESLINPEDADVIEAYVIEIDNSGEWKTHKIDWRSYTATITDRLMERARTTLPGAPMPTPNIPQEWIKTLKDGSVENRLCGGYCGFHQCEYHAENPQRQ